MHPIPSRRFHVVAAALLSFSPGNAVCGSGQADAASLSASNLIYEKTTEDILNPDRGFFVPQDGFTRESLRDIRRVRKASVIRSLFRLDPYRSGPLSASFLEKVNADLGLVREAGLKVIIRFTYSLGLDEPDAPLARILSHIDQLSPVLTANADIITMLEAGFIGAWGEWHGSTHGLETPENRKAVLLKLLSALPAGRMVAVRCNFHKRGALENDKPLAPEEAFDGSPRSRVGAHNDCLGASQTDFGTYSDNALEAEKTFLSLDNRYVPQAGETCNPSPYAQCAGMLGDLKRMRWDMLNLGYHPAVLDGWRQEGCFREVETRLGYRFVLLRSTLQDSVRPGGGLRISLALANEGWGKAFNPRGLELVLREERTQARYILTLPDDPRRWSPGDSVSLEVTGGIPSAMPPGRYRVFLNLPDPMPRLRSRPEYSIRLANTGLWEDSTGLNSLRHSVVVSSAAPGPAYAGAAFVPAGPGETVAITKAEAVGDGERATARRNSEWLGKGFDLRGRSVPGPSSRIP